MNRVCDNISSCVVNGIHCIVEWYDLQFGIFNFSGVDRVWFPQTGP